MKKKQPSELDKAFLKQTFQKPVMPRRLDLCSLVDPSYSCLPATDSPETKKLSVTLKNVELVEKVASKYRWSINELVNYCLELFLTAVIDTDENNEVLLEAPCFQDIKNYAAKNKIPEGEVIRYALEIFTRLSRDGIIARGLRDQKVKNGERSLPGIFSDLLKRALQEKRSLQRVTAGFSRQNRYAKDGDSDI